MQVKINDLHMVTAINALADYGKTDPDTVVRYAIASYLLKIGDLLENR